MSDTPTVTTLHGRLDKPEFASVFRAYRNANYVAISKSQQSYLPDVNWAGVVHHSVDVHSFTFYPDPGDYLVFVGRISPEKRPDRAIAVAKKTGIPLKIAAKVDPSDQEYYDQHIRPLIENEPLVEFIGPVGEAQKRELMGNALALIVPIDWPEPFGIVFIEALACGTPVLTCPCGSVPELLEDGVTGYISATVDDLAEAALKVRSEISRQRCRAYAEERFDIPRMALDYLKVFDKLVLRQRLFALPYVSMDIEAKEMAEEPAILITATPGLTEVAALATAESVLAEKLSSHLPLSLNPDDERVIAP